MFTQGCARTVPFRTISLVPGEPRLLSSFSGVHYKTDAEEFYRGRRFHNRKDLARKLKRWEKEYNEQRPHFALKGKTTAERVLELARKSQTVRDHP